MASKVKNRPRQSLRSTMKATKYMMRFVWRIQDGKKYIFLHSFVSILTAVLPLALVYMPGLIINELTGARRVDVLLIYIGITVGIPFIQSVVVSSLNVYLNNLRYLFMVRVKVDYISHCADMDLESMENPDIQILRERAEETSSNSLNTFGYLSGLASAVISVIMCASIISVLNPLLLALVIAVVIINYANSKWLEKKKYSINIEIGKLNRFGWPVTNYLSDLRYAKEVRLYQLKDYFTRLYRDKRMEAGEYGKKDAAYTRRNGLIGAVVSLFQNVLLYGYFVYQVVIGALAVGDMTIYMGAISQFTASLNNVTRQYLNLSMLSLSVQELMEFMKIPLKNLNSGSDTPEFDKNSVIEFKNVSFRYPGSEKYALKNLNIVIHGNEKLCIVGVNGSGKSTFVKLLTRLYMPTEGEILLNGKNINEYDYLQYSRLFSSVFQDFALYNLSLGENIVMADEYHFERLESAVRESGLSSLVSSNKNGYDTIIYKWYDPEGIEPSGGEGQRIAIARACYHGRDIYILDEPTAALDPMAEYEIYTQFNSMITGKCAILITHRLSAVQLADKVAVFDDGQVAECGTHTELYAKGGIYTEMFDKQAQFYRDKKPQQE